MAKVTNTHRATPIGLAGIRILPGQTAEVADWDKFKDRQNIKHYLDQKVLVVGGDAAESVNEDSEKEALIAELKTYGIDATTRNKVETLREKLEEAKAKQGQ
ncbi:hypothetical protein ACVA51_10770 [Pseudomonas luteola]